MFIKKKASVCQRPERCSVLLHRVLVERKAHVGVVLVVMVLSGHTVAEEAAGCLGLGIALGLPQLQHNPKGQPTPFHQQLTTFLPDFAECTRATHIEN